MEELELIQKLSEKADELKQIIEALKGKKVTKIKINIELEGENENV